MLIRHTGRRRVQGGAVSIGRAGRGRTECRHWSEGGRLDLATIAPSGLARAHACEASAPPAALGAAQWLRVSSSCTAYGSFMLKPRTSELDSS